MTPALLIPSALGLLMGLDQIPKQLIRPGHRPVADGRGCTAKRGTMHVRYAARP